MDFFTGFDVTIRTSGAQSVGDSNVSSEPRRLKSR
jgi:hypothetical protein